MGINVPDSEIEIDPTKVYYISVNLHRYGAYYACTEPIERILYGCIAGDALLYAIENYDCHYRVGYFPVPEFGAQELREILIEYPDCSSCLLEHPE